MYDSYAKEHRERRQDAYVDVKWQDGPVGPDVSGENGAQIEDAKRWGGVIRDLPSVWAVRSPAAARRPVRGARAGRRYG